MVVKWNPALAVGHAEIDGQHRELFRRFGALVAAMQAGMRADIGALFDFLGEYAVHHFEAEERAMRETSYPGATVHKAVHDRFLREYRDLKRLYEENGPTCGVKVKTRIWIEDWLESHIAGIDRALARHLQSRQSPGAVAAPARARPDWRAAPR